ncbi:MAG: bifunctional glutamate N-acetyltransferase/amino-acid acetyltransferase ArgJ [Candidatus Magnetoovum sp. WYHC-5]|nr:bifunctional glutamate N-acetyltransferase/amino-acid acetyltransferase ArgJ [Candidatus Magnetoovum sp. WYHC-5]
MTKDIIINPKGFLYAVESASIKKAGNRDIAIIHSEVPCVVSGVFTCNKVKAAPVLLDMERVQSGSASSVVINSGNANACTGKQGMEDAILMADTLAQALGVERQSTLVASTGVIGQVMPMEKIVPAIKRATGLLGKHTALDAAQAIMTTDTFPKIMSIGNSTGAIIGISKGAGMIHPNMATTLTFIMTDFAITKVTLDRLLKEAVDRSFNRITVDGDMSTNDTVLVLANGLSGNTDAEAFADGLNTITEGLAKMVVKDGEGATKVFTVRIKNAKTHTEADRFARTVANSPLVKTAMYGKDANWGRIISALGYAGPDFNPENTDIYFDDILIAKGGISMYADKEAELVLNQNEFDIIIDLHMGQAQAHIVTCDLTEEYIRINGAYRT